MDKEMESAMDIVTNSIVAKIRIQVLNLQTNAETIQEAAQIEDNDPVTWRKLHWLRMVGGTNIHHLDDQWREYLKNELMDSEESD
jgi:hypothetical protein